MMSGNGSSRTGLEPMRAWRKCPVGIFSEAVSLQGGRSSHSNKKTGLWPVLLPSQNLNLGPP